MDFWIVFVVLYCVALTYSDISNFTTSKYSKTVEFVLNLIATIISALVMYFVARVFHWIFF